MVKRIRLYLSIMFPVAPMLVFCAIQFLAVYLWAATALDPGPVRLGAAVVVGWFSLFLFLLFLRVSDEIKDQDSDPHFFPSRPLPSGKVRPADLWVLWSVCLGLLLALNAFLPVLWIPFALVLGYLLLMFRYFFMRQPISNNILLANLTHNPSGFLLHLYTACVAASVYQQDIWQASVLLTALTFWPLSILWEVSRKIRSPDEETDYQTYSMVLGPRKAAGLAVALLAIFGALVSWGALVRETHWLFVGLFGAASLALLLVYGRFVRWPDQGGLHLKTLTEIYIALVLVAVVIERLLTHGARFV